MHVEAYVSSFLNVMIILSNEGELMSASHIEF